ncbi:TetR/AcrR family transcriptional regulator [Streptomyces sp. cg35]|uniref:TetR/AcrR family transcriptional regulator n=1 Tax=Streptomyces sp. cg35 TaxID=3421650 RepID=UPI003D168CDA
MEGDASASDAPQGGQGLRLDARRNRRRILTAAREVFAERGIDAAMSAVARRAGVGVATLYRHFPTRDDLVQEAFAEQMTACAGVLTRAVADADPWRGFSLLVEELCRLQREERGFPEAFLAAFPGQAQKHSEARTAAERHLTGLIRRAQAAGALRPDFAPSDLIVALVAHGGLVTALPEDDAASRRLVAYLLDAFRATPRHTALPAASELALSALPSTATARRPHPPHPPVAASRSRRSP